MDPQDFSVLKSSFEKNLSELSLLLNETPLKVKKCKHSKSDPDLRILIDKEFFSKVTSETLANFIILTGVDQTLFRKAPHLSIEFKKIFTNLPIPVNYSGFGCIYVLTPHELNQMYFEYNKKFNS